MNLKLFTISTLIALALVFIVQNAEIVEMRFLFWKLSMSRSLMFAFLVLIGIAVGWLIRGHLLHKSQRNTK